MATSKDSGLGKRYLPHEERRILELRAEGHLWPDIAKQFNEEVDSDRQRTAGALQNKWRSLKSNGKIEQVRGKT